jgi:hypothetical protein
MVSKDIITRANWTKELEKRYFGKKISTTAFGQHLWVKHYEHGITIQVRGQNKIALNNLQCSELSVTLDRIITAEEVAKRV